MSYLPNRIYYPELKDMDSDRLHQTLINVLLYSLLELISLVVLDVVLRRLVHFSPVSQLAFVLKTQWRMSSLVHFGADYSFKFAWLRDPPTI
ncbi:hypothetical protein F442_11412 [Phytophthora nicotianae P10297]|uniref:Uncharacterized protein n=2 Tax=Phytophthora nicotianae TaxID=4792 RepID=W2Q4M0_PHYN3|nr:hypothetical protein PPTG_23243 [Phytophthora nicotianae INRA-310]ETN07215.1 hypothetical protein PPTG_23243 [Phytophthora nicotianae INRA-310]ETP41445.1 hypothetical protein F442_11412 [Phytophthora nicotianae P10297]